MKNRISINSEVSLVEIIMSILIFAIAGAIMLNCFGAAKFTQIKANDKVESGNIVQSIVEVIKSFDTNTEVDEYMAECFQILKTDETEKIYVHYYDEYWNLCKNENDYNKEYFITVKISDVFSDSGTLKRFIVSSEKITPYPFISKTEESCKLYEIETKKFFSDTRR